MFEGPPAAVVGRFDGPTVEERDRGRLTTQLTAVRSLLSSGDWWTLPALVDAVRRSIGHAVSEAGVSARIRDLRKARFGGLTIGRRRVRGSASFEYRLEP